MDSQSFISLFTDGGARGNPGPSAIGVYIVDNAKKPLHRSGKKIGIATNNIAEYTAVLEGFLWIVTHYKEIHTPKTIYVFSDSLLIVSQLKGIWKIKNSRLYELLLKIKELEKQLDASIVYSHIPREQNKEADSLVNKALDNIL